MVRTLRHDDGSWNSSAGGPALAQARFSCGADPERTSGRLDTTRTDLPRWPGGADLLPPMDCGTYLVDDAMVEELRLARRGEHA